MPTQNCEKKPYGGDDANYGERKHKTHDNHAPGSHLSIMVYFLRFQGVSFNAMRSCSDFSASPKPAAIARRRHNK